MKSLKYFGKLFGELFGYAMKNKAWWLIPLVLILVVFGILIAIGQTSVPFIYTLF